MPSQNDKTATEIVSALRAVGATVRFIAFEFGQAGCPDLLVGYGGSTYLMELKTKRGRLSSAQHAFVTEWRGGAIAVIRTPEEALAMIGLSTWEGIR